MPLDDTRARPKPKAPPARAPAKPDPHAIARAELDRSLAGLLARAKTTKSRAVLTYWAAPRAGSQNDAWREASRRALIAAGVLTDYTATPLPVG